MWGEWCLDVGGMGFRCVEWGIDMGSVTCKLISTIIIVFSQMGCRYGGNGVEI